MELFLRILASLLLLCLLLHPVKKKRKEEEEKEREGKKEREEREEDEKNQREESILAPLLSSRSKASSFRFLPPRKTHSVFLSEGERKRKREGRKKWETLRNLPEKIKKSLLLRLSISLPPSFNDFLRKETFRGKGRGFFLLLPREGEKPPDLLFHGKFWGALKGGEEKRRKE